MEATIWKFYYGFNLFADHPILQILESRTGDRLAAEFVKKQKQRFAIK